ncbi:hypothetical protein ACS0TY_002007 [Phlomoides rotata]
MSPVIPIKLLYACLLFFYRMKTRLGDPVFKPQRKHILVALDSFCTFIHIRYSSPLFRLHSANAIQARVQFHNTGSSSVPGVIVISIEE